MGACSLLCSWGGVLAAPIYAGNHFSGAHFNPAITLAVWICGKLDGASAALYFGVQVIAGIFGATVARLFVNAPSRCRRLLPRIVLWSWWSSCSSRSCWSVLRSP
ncbi:aquaporin [Lentzea pudingi]|uniref:aquaporin n=1 Tax=Lentzea pudingi TaxID=1789439 RepID=UPI0035716F0A